MEPIYKNIEKNWKNYALMSGILIIEEVSKPVKRLQTKNYKGKIMKYYCYNTVRLKMKDRETVQKWFDITKNRENKLNQKFIGKSFTKIKRENSGQYYFLFTPNWAYHILKTIKKFPSKYTTEKFTQRVSDIKDNGSNYLIDRKEIEAIKDSKEKVYDLLFKEKYLAAGAFIISFDLECRGAQYGRLDLTMSERYKDFLEYMLSVAKRWSWSTKKELSKVKVDYSIQRGINANPQYCFRIKTSKLKEIYDLAGPLLDKHKDKCIKFHIKRSTNYVNFGGSKIGTMKNKLYILVKKLGPIKSTELQFYVNIGVDVILVHLNNLHKEELINKERKGKGYMWSIKNAS